MVKIGEIVFSEFDLQVDLIVYRASSSLDMMGLKTTYPDVFDIINIDLNKFGAYTFAELGVIAINTESECNLEWALLTHLYYWINRFNAHMNLNDSANEIGARLMGYCVERFLPLLRQYVRDNINPKYNSEIKKLKHNNSIFKSTRYKIYLVLYYYDQNDESYYEMLQKISNSKELAYEQIMSAEGFTLPVSSTNDGFIAVNKNAKHMREAIIAHELYHWIISYKAVNSITLADETIIFGRAIKQFYL